MLLAQGERLRKRGPETGGQPVSEILVKACHIRVAIFSRGRSLRPSALLACHLPANGTVLSKRIGRSERRAGRMTVREGRTVLPPVNSAAQRKVGRPEALASGASSRLARERSWMSPPAARISGAAASNPAARKIRFRVGPSPISAAPARRLFAKPGSDLPGSGQSRPVPIAASRVRLAGVGSASPERFSGRTFFSRNGAQRCAERRSGAGQGGRAHRCRRSPGSGTPAPGG